MVVTITERLADVAHDIGAAHGQIIFSLDPADAGRPHLGHAAVRVAAPVARLEGVAVIVGDDKLSGVPDPLRILVRDASWFEPAPTCTLSIRRRALPVLLSVDPIAGSARFLRRIRVPTEAAGIADEPVVPAGHDDPGPGTADAVEE
jgi:hypothetical protein